LYAKLYTGTAAADQLLRDVVKPLTEEVIESGAVESWFFVRYGDPDWHLRLRFKGSPERLHAEVLPALRSAAASLLEDGRVWRLQLDTYEREIERYGGLEGIDLAERLFHVDSEAVLEIIELLEPGDVGLDERWRLTLLGMDHVLENFGLDLATKHAVVEAARSRFAKEFRVDEWIGPRLGERFRLERSDLEVLLDLTEDADHPLAQGIEILQGRSRRWAPVIAELQACAQDGRLAMPLNDLAATHMHMHANRLLRAAQRAQELVIYDFLERLYASRLARASGAQ
jgi:thiopeptide-type bacteriocin biosynthesis protein